MKLKLSILFFFFYLIGEAQSRFQKYFSGFIENQKFSISSFDSTYVIAGNSWFEGSFYDFCAVKLDKNGKVLWSKSFPSSNDDYLSALSISSSGDILLSGYKSGNMGDFDFSLMKLNSSGNIQWYKTYGTVNSEISLCSGGTPAGHVFLFGNREVNQRPCVIKTNGTGAVFWGKTFGTLTGGEEGLSSVITKDGGLVICGALPAQKYFIMKIDKDGAISWANSYTASHTQFLASIKQTSDGGFLLANSDYRCDTSGCHSYFSFIKLDASGNVSFAKAVENFIGAGRSAIETADGGFAITGQLRDSMYNKAVLIKTDNKGNLFWAKAYGSVNSFAESLFVEQTYDGAFALFGVEDSKAYFIKTDQNGNTGCNEKTIIPVLSNVDFTNSIPIVVPATKDSDIVSIALCTDSARTLKDSIICNSSMGIDETLYAANFIIYPNPFNWSATLEIIDYKLLLSGSKFNMYDVFGRQVMQLPFDNHQLLISRGDLPKGMYFYEVYNGGKVIGKGKIIAE